MIDKARRVDTRRIGGDLWLPLLLLAAGVLFFADALFSSKNFYFRDILNFHYPLRRVLIEAYARGEFPLWNPFIYLGQPMLANPNYMAFYLSNLFHLVLPFDYAFKLHFVVHPLAGGLGIYFLQRRLGIEATAAFGGSLAYQLSGPVLSFLNLYNIVPAVALLPWTGWALVRAQQERSHLSVVLFGAILGLQFTAFEPLMFQCSLVLTAGLILLHVCEASDRRKAVLGDLRVALYGMLLGLALAAVQILPTLELLPRSARLSGYDFNIQARWSMHPVDFLNTVVPNLFGTPYTMYRTVYWGEAYHDGRESYLVSFFLGTSVVLLAAFSAFSPRSTIRRILLGGVGVSALLALGKFLPTYRWMYEFLPLVRLGRYPSKYFLLGTLCLAVLASLGLEALLNAGNADARARRRMRGVAFLALLVALFAAVVWIYFRTNSGAFEAVLKSVVPPSVLAMKSVPVIFDGFLSSVRTAGLFLSVSGVLILLLLRSRSLPYPGLLLAVAVGAELAASNLRLTPLVSSEDFRFVSEVETYLARPSTEQPHRVVSFDSLRSVVPSLTVFSPQRSWVWFTLFYRMSGQPMYGIMHDIQYSLDQTVDYLNTRESETLSKLCAALTDEKSLALLAKINSPVVLSLREIRSERLESSASFEALASEKLNVYRLKNGLPRAYFVGGVDRVASQREALDRLLSSEFSYRDTVILEGPANGAPAPGDRGGTTRILQYRAGRVVCEVEAAGPGHLILLDSYYPGWSAYVDGNSAALLRGNYAFRAVPLEAGRHVVEFRYEPYAFYAGLGISSLAMVGVIGLMTGDLILRRRRRGVRS